MPGTLRLSLLGLAAAAGMAGAACHNLTGDNTSSTTWGDPVTFAGGSVRTYLVSHDGAPAELGVAVSQATMAGLPDDGPGHGGMTPLLLPLPAGMGGMPYKLVEVDWNPHGHDPTGIYGVPHFDFHFYTISRAEHDAIVPSDPQFEQKAANRPAAELLPPGYAAGPDAIPQMGVHWIDTAAPELNGQPFTHTLIYGSWDGRVTFVEPMITRAFLQSHTAFEAPLPVPQRVAQPGLYPTTQKIYWDAEAQEVHVALSGFAARQ